MIGMDHVNTYTIDKGSSWENVGKFITYLVGRGTSLIEYRSNCLHV